MRTEVNVHRYHTSCTAQIRTLLNHLVFLWWIFGIRTLDDHDISAIRRFLERQAIVLLALVNIASQAAEQWSKKGLLIIHPEVLSRLKQC